MCCLLVYLTMAQYMDSKKYNEHTEYIMAISLALKAAPALANMSAAKTQLWMLTRMVRSYPNTLSFAIACKIETKEKQLNLLRIMRLEMKCKGCKVSLIVFLSIRKMIIIKDNLAQKKTRWVVKEVGRGQFWLLVGLKDLLSLMGSES
jgi:hypothetical protein